MRPCILYRQEQVNTGDWMFDTKANWIYFWYERNSFPTQSVAIKLIHHKSTPAQQIPRQKKIGKCAGVGLEATTFSVANHACKDIVTTGCSFAGFLPFFPGIVRFQTHLFFHFYLYFIGEYIFRQICSVNLCNFSHHLFSLVQFTLCYQPTCWFRENTWNITNEVMKFKSCWSKFKHIA